MKRFRFSLESVLAFRREKERAACERLFGAIKARQEIEQRELRLRVRVEQCALESRQRLARRASAAELYALQKCALWLGDLQRGLELEKARADESVRAARHRLTAARREREVLEKYRERMQAAHAREGLRLEQKTLDELATRAAFAEPSRAVQLIESP